MSLSAPMLALVCSLVPAASLRAPPAGVRGVALSTPLAGVASRAAAAARSGGCFAPSAVHARRSARVLMAEKYSQKTRLAEEVASPFAKARSFAWPALFAAASIATYFAGTSLLAEAAGLRPAAGDTALNLGVDLASMAGTGYLWRNENAAREARLARLSQGAIIAALRAQVLGSGDAQFVRLSDFRSGRGEARRVVLVVAEEPALRASIVEAAAAASQIASADFLVVPVLLPGGLSSLASPLAMLSEGGAESLASRFAPLSLAVPVEADLPQWQAALAEELKNAKTQAGEDAAARGFTVLLKKNGRVGTRRLGTPDWQNLVGDVASRGAAGLDITNI